MNTEPGETSKPISEAKLKANRKNGRLTRGPKDTTRSRFNARKHGLTAGITCLGLDTPQNYEFIRLACARMGPRNPLEESFMIRLLWKRLQEGVFLDVERTVLTRKPATVAPDDERSYPFLDDPHGLKTLEALARQLTHFTRVGQDEILGLLQVRKENWDSGGQKASHLDLDTAEESVAKADAAAEKSVDHITPTIWPGTLEACLADTRPILDGENAQDYEILVREMWGCLRPANTLQGFVAIDLIQAHRRIVRVMGITNILFERCAVSPSSGLNCGVGFAFINDAQQDQALASLRQYEAALQTRFKKRMALLRKLRKEGWQDAAPADPPRPPAQPPTTVARPKADPSDKNSTKPTAETYKPNELENNPS